MGASQHKDNKILGVGVGASGSGTPIPKMNIACRVMTNLFHSAATSGVYTITVDITLLTDNTVELVLKGTPQYVAYATYFTTYPCPGCISEIDSSGTCTVKLGAHSTIYTYTNFYFIYAMKTYAMAEAARKILPSIKYTTRQIACKNDLFMIYVADIYEAKIINYGTVGKVLIHGGTTQKIAPGELIVLNPFYSALADIRIRADGMPKDIAYKDLTLEEQEAYIPEDVYNGLTRTTNWSTIHNWMDAKTCLYQGTLTYTETRDKDIHMVDDKGNKEELLLCDSDSSVD